VPVTLFQVMPSGALDKRPHDAFHKACHGWRSIRACAASNGSRRPPAS